MELKDVYRYVRFIYECHRCGQHYPIWLVSDKDWKKGVKKMGPNFGPSKHICKGCFEEFNESPRYLTLDEYMELQAATCAEIFKKEMSPKTASGMRETLTALWDLSSEYTEDERDETIVGIGWRRGPYHK